MATELKKYALRTDQGPFFDINEDEVLVDLNHNLFGVIDGLGGTNIGDKAAQMVKQNLQVWFPKIASDPDSTMPFFYNPQFLLEGNALLNAVQKSHEDLMAENQDKSINSQGAVSLVALALSEGPISLVSIGNVCAYHYCRGHLVAVNLPDTFMGLGTGLGPKRQLSYPTQALGLLPQINPRLHEIKVWEGDFLLVLSDGVYAHLNEQEILFVLNQADLGPSEKIDLIFKMANKLGNFDNQSALLLQF